VPKVQPEYLEQRRTQILDAAAACFARRGFHQTTMQDICEEADLSPGAVYRYFPSKEAIIEGMAHLRQGENSALIEEAMARGSTIEVLDELLRFFFLEVDPQELQARCAIVLEIISEAPRNPRIRQSQSEATGTVLRLVMELIQSSQARGEINPELEPEAVARVMLGIYYGFVAQKLVDPDFDSSTYVGAVQALFGGSFWQGRARDAEPQPAAALRH
jgi:AcrR family transcriptional regulator